MSALRYVGVDGTKGGWVAVSVDDSGFVRAQFFGDFAAVVVGAGDAAVIAVDMPLGLTEREPRGAEMAMRAGLAGQASSVFNAPIRGVLSCTDYAEANALSQGMIGKGISKQTWAIVPKIAEVDAFVEDGRVHEVHPELCFRELGRGARLGKKKTWAGIRARVSLLDEAGIVVPSDLGEAGALPADDVLDAAVAAWTARRIAHRVARSFPAVPTQWDRCGRAIRVWA